MKQPMDWHRDAIANWRRSLNADHKRLQDELSRLHRSQYELEFYERQIAEAEKRGMTDFDRERLLVKRQQAKV